MKSLLPVVFLILLCSCGYTPTSSPLIITGGEKSLPALQGPVIKFMSWNIHKEGNEKNWINDILNTDCTKDPDILLFQEASLNAGLKYVLKVKDLDWKFVSNAIKDKEYTGVLTASKSNSSINIPLISDGREPITETPKVSLITSCVVNTKGMKTPLLIANVHGINFVRLKDFDGQIKNLYDKLLPYVEDRAIIVAGDFNTWSSDRVSILNKYFSKLKLEEIKLKKAATPAWYVWLFTPVERLALDRVYYSVNKLSIETSEVLDCVKSSDHKPIYIEFIVR